MQGGVGMLCLQRTKRLFSRFFAERFVMAVAGGPFIHGYEVVWKRLHEHTPPLV
jgi:hypothetical protein